VVIPPGMRQERGGRGITWNIGQVNSDLWKDEPVQCAQRARKAGRRNNQRLSIERWEASAGVYRVPRGEGIRACNGVQVAHGWSIRWYCAVLMAVDPQSQHYCVRSEADLEGRCFITAPRGGF